MSNKLPRFDPIDRKKLKEDIELLSVVYSQAKWLFESDLATTRDLQEYKMLIVETGQKIQRSGSNP